MVCLLLPIFVGFPDSYIELPVVVEELVNVSFRVSLLKGQQTSRSMS